MLADHRSLLAATAVLALAACVPVPKPGVAPAMQTADTIDASQTLAARGETIWPPDQWWRLASDPQLTALIEEGLANSPQVAIAMARIGRAEAEAQRVGAGRLPSIGIEGEGGLRRQSGNTGIPAQFLPDGWKDYGQVSLTFGFDLDLWGRNRAALAAATSDARAAAVDAASSVCSAWSTSCRPLAAPLPPAAMLTQQSEVSDRIACRSAPKPSSLAAAALGGPAWRPAGAAPVPPLSAAAADSARIVHASRR